MSETVRFDHYEVLTRDDGSLFELGRGAMGVTYKALDTNLRIPVALKVIGTAHLHSEVARQRFIREARSAARLRNPHVAAVYHLGLDGDTWFYAMEFIDGETVDALIKRNGPLPPKLALEITDQVAKALQAAEPHGLVHRDIKPANLMVVRDGEQIVVKVIDFGLAKSSLPEDESATLSMGGFVGTPHFASPEQLEERDLDVRSDIYSVGVTLWFMLAGRTPFAGSMAQVMSQHLSKTPPFERLNVPAPLARLLRRVLEKKPADRPQNTTEFRREIARCLSELDSPDALVTQSEPVSPRDAQESFLTLVDPSLVREGAVKFEPGELVAARYRIIEALGDSNLGRNFRAHDQTRATDVKIIVLHEAIALSTETLSALERIVELLAPRPHEYVQRVDAIETLEGATFLVLEWCEGASLVELLRVRREMTAEETVSLLGPAAGALDHVLACGLDEVDLALPQVNVVFSQKPGTGWMKTPLREWPAHTVKINPLNSRAVTAAGETWAGGQTLVDGPRADRGGAAARAVRALAAIAYEALGGKLSPAALANQGVQFKPLAALTEAGNEVLRCALSRDPGFPSVSSFIGALATPENAGLAYRATPEPLTEARTRARRSEATSVPTPTEPSVSPARTPGETAPARKGSPLPIFVLLAVVASGGALWYFKFALKPVAPPSSSISTPAATPNPSSESEVSPSPSPSPEAVRREMLAAAMKEARALEAKQSWAECLAAWVKIVQDFPESEAGKTNLETVCNTLRSRPDGIGGDAFAPLREPLANAAQLDVLSAMMVLAENLRRTAPGESLHWFQRAGELGDLEGLTQAGLMISNDQDDPQRFEKAVALFQRAAEKGHLSAKTSLGECLLYGKGIEKNEAGALEMLQQAAAANDRRAHDLLGTYYVKEARTSGRRESEANELFGKAAKHFERAADLGLVRALGNLGVLHINGQGVPKDPRRAFALIQKGAEGKEAFCMVLLAQCYESGTGVSAPNLQKAREWYQLAADAGNAKAAEWIKSKGVTPAPNP